VLDAAQGPDGADEGAHEAQVDEGDEEAVGAGAVPGEEGGDGPDAGEDRDDEEDEDGVRGEGVGAVVEGDEVGEHAYYWDQGEDLEEAPEGEEDAAEHFEGGVGVCLLLMVPLFPSFILSYSLRKSDARMQKPLSYMRGVCDGYKY